MLEIGEKVYCVEIKEKRIVEAIIIGAGISTTGYLQYALRTNEAQPRNVRLDYALVFKDENEANIQLPTILKLEDDMKAVIKEYDAKLNAMRETLLGKPEFKHLLMEKN